MKTFSHWRAVGRAMRWARQQEGVTVHRSGLKPWKRLSWSQYDSGNGVGIQFRADREGCRLAADFAEGWITGSTFDNAGVVLRVLAALDLIPAHLAYGPDERYGRCVKCDRLAQWWPAEAEAAARWAHVERVRFDGNPHLAEVAE